MTVEIVVACTPDGVIGKNGTVPWYFSEDLQRFKNMTMDHFVVMGRRTYESLGNRPLRSRKNIVITSKEINNKEVMVCRSLREAIDYAKAHGAKKCFLIGGQRIYEEGLGYANMVHLTKVNMTIPEGEAFFPLERMNQIFEPVIEKKLNNFIEFVTLKRRSNLPLHTKENEALQHYGVVSYDNELHSTGGISQEPQDDSSPSHTNSLHSRDDADVSLLLEVSAKVVSHS